MKQLAIIFLLAASALGAEKGIDPKRAANTVVLTATGEKNLRIETEMMSEETFETTVFALGEVQADPARRTVVGTRAEGHIVSLAKALGDSVEANEEVASIRGLTGENPPVLPLRAISKGIVTECLVRLGDPVASDSVLFEITDLSEVLVKVRVPEHRAASLAPGTTARILVLAASAEPFPAKMVMLGTKANAESATIDAIFSLTNPELKLRPGMRAEVNVVLSTRKSVLVIPRAALLGQGADRFVFVRPFDETLKHTYEKAPVVIGEMNDKFVEIKSGLLGVEEVVTRGGYSLANAGGGAMSLKEALDAAHGHEHNDDGSEVTAAQKAALKSPADGQKGGPQGEDNSLLWKIISGVLAALLVVAGLRGRAPAPNNTEVTTPHA